MKHPIKLLLILLLICVPALACADVLTDFYITKESGANLTADGRPVDYIYPYVKSNGKCYLLLPHGMDATRLMYVAKEGVEYYIDGELLASGTLTDKFVPGETLDLYNAKGKKAKSITVMQGSNISALFLVSESGSMKKINGKKDDWETGNALWLKADGETYADKLTSLKKRGNSSGAYPKKSYRIKFDKKVDLTGGGRAKTWELLANYMDISHLRNRITLDMAAYVGLPYTTDCEAVDVYALGEYLGLYLLTERIQIDDARIDITDLGEENEFANPNPPETYETFIIGDKNASLPIVKGYRLESEPEDITGGYVVEVEKPHRFNGWEDNGFKTQLGMTMIVKEPEYASENELRYIGEIFNAFHRAIVAKDGIDPVTGAYYLERFDLDSLVKKYMLEEISKNYDAHSSSQFFYKDKDSVDKMVYSGPAWDYDLTYGLFSEDPFLTARNPQSLFLHNNNRKHLMYNHLYKHADFKAHLLQVYHSDYRPALETLLGLREPREGYHLTSIDSYAAEIAASAQMNGAVWRVNSEKGFETKSGTDFEKAVVFLKDYLMKRMVFLNTEWAMPNAD